MSSPELVVRYLRQRARPRVFVPLALCLAGVGAFITSSSTISAAAFILATLQAFLLVLAFRVWDDLEDRERDRARYPSRVMPADRRTVPFVALSLAFAVAALIPMTGAPNPRARLASLGVAVIVLVVWYRLRPATAGGNYLILIKYPLIAYATVPGLLPSPAAMWPRQLSALAALYIAICVAEFLDDRSLRQSSTTPGLP